MGNFFHSPRKVTGQNLDKFKVPCKCDRSDYKYQPVTAEGELTLEGARRWHAEYPAIPQASAA